MANMAAGRAIVEALKAEGVDHIFGVVGTTTNSIVTELYGRDDIRFIDTRHEEGAAFMAYGYSRASGKPSACVTTSGPGTINLATGISLAYKGRAPVMRHRRQHRTRNTPTATVPRSSTWLAPSSPSPNCPCK